MLTWLAVSDHKLLTYMKVHAGVGKQTETQSQSCEGTFYCRANAQILVIENTLSHEAFYGDCKFTQLRIILSLLF